VSFRLRLHIHVDDGHSLGPGKIALLEAIDAEGSISAAARAMDMAYRHAWELVDDMNQCFRGGVVITGTGGSDGGGARLTPMGRNLVTRFRAMERGANAVIAADLAALEVALARAPARRAGAKKKRAGRAAR
jgi:molybdate transport system regulatory protein